ncbi:MAG: dihydropteroate synthase [Lachnospiraceae bacterium]|nr:dihydropteroate synthase [Lachnospiraceae bacterium]
MIIGGREFDTENNIYIMGILNVTPDSFSDGGCFDKVDKALKRVGVMIEEGADIIDIGAESTRPGSEQVSADDEINRLKPVLEAIKREYDVPVSIDTYKYETAEKALEAGADLINDIWGLKYDDGRMADVIARFNVPCVLMHNRKVPEYLHIINDVIEDLNESVIIANDAGIEKSKIILDPGIGFAKSYNENLEILNNLDAFSRIRYPMLLGCSRKSVIGNALDLPVDKRLEGTIVTTILASQAGYSFVRVHDIKENKRALSMLKAVTSAVLLDE